jgi:hypothetical protein
MLVGMNSSMRSRGSLYVAIGSFALGLLLGVAVSSMRSSERSAVPADLDGIRARLTSIQAVLDEDRRFVRDALERLEAAREPSARTTLPGQDAAAAELPGAIPVDLDARSELAALREQVESLGRERTLAEIAALQVELDLPRADGSAISLADLRSMQPAERSAALRWRSFEDVQRMLGLPDRIHPQGTKLMWEYDHPEGGLLGMRFANGRVEDAWN